MGRDWEERRGRKLTSECKLINLKFLKVGRHRRRTGCSSGKGDMDQRDLHEHACHPKNCPLLPGLTVSWVHIQSPTFTLQSSQVCLPTLMTSLPTKKNKKEKIPTKSPVCIAHILTGAWSTPRDLPLKLNPSPPTPMPKAINRGELHFSIFIIILRVLSDGFLSRLLLLSWGGYGGSRGCHRSLLCPLFSTVSLQPSISLQI